jgi:hypothetical protein
MESEFIYRSSKSGPPIAQNATMGVKFSQKMVILDPWYIMGGNKWTRTLFRLRHPIIYSKRGILSLYRRIKYIFIKPTPYMCREWITKEEALKMFPKDKQ